jgi:hypothetical protein
MRTYAAFHVFAVAIDGSPAWNRTSDAMPFPGLNSSDGTRQIFVINIRRRP